MSSATYDRLTRAAALAERAYLAELRREYGRYWTEVRYSVLGILTPELSRLFNLWRDSLSPLRIRIER